LSRYLANQHSDPPLRPSMPRARSPRGRRAAAEATLRRIFINRNYAIFMVGAFVSATGSWGQAVALSWLVLELGNSEFLLGLTNFAAMVPLLVLSIPAGAIVDRFNHKTLLLVAQTGTMAANAILAVATIAGVRSIPLILICALMGGLFNAIGWPLWSVFINDLVGPEHLRSAVALNSVRFNLLLAAYGAGVCLGISALSSLGVIFAIIAIRVPPSKPRAVMPWTQSVREGLAFCWSDKSALRLLLLTTAPSCETCSGGVRNRSGCSSRASASGRSEERLSPAVGTLPAGTRRVSPPSWSCAASPWPPFPSPAA